MSFMETMIHRLFKTDLEWGLLTPALGHQLLLVRLSTDERQVKVTPALATPETAAQILESESAWELALDWHTARVVDTESPNVAGQGSPPVAVPSGVSPIVRSREHAGRRPPRRALIEEFRHYHRLAKDRKRGSLVEFDRAGGEGVVATVGATHVTARRKHLMQFLAGTDRHLVLFADVTDHGEIPGDGRAGIRPVDGVSDICKKRDRWIRVDDAEGGSRRLLRKIVFSPPSREGTGAWPRMPAKETTPFVIGCNPLGNDVEDVSPPGKRRIVAPLTRVFFMGAVLDKYRGSDRHRVSSRDLTCEEHWWCPMIVDDELDLVSVYYDDLRNRIPPREQLHWRQYNIAANEIGAHAFHDADLSDTGPPSPRLLQRQYNIEGIETGPGEDSAKVLEELLQDIPPTYRRFNSRWKDTEEWPFFDEDGDQKLLDRIKVRPRDRDQAVSWAIALNSLLVEGLAESEMQRATERPRLPGQPPPARFVNIIMGTSSPHREKGGKASAVLETYLEHRGFPNAGLVAEVIRDLSDVRAVYTHRENRGHEIIKERTGVDLDEDHTEGCRILAHKGLNMLKLLEKHFMPGRDREDH